jgi:uncharacterized membrane protein
LYTLRGACSFSSRSLAAIAGAFAGYHVRRQLSMKLNVPDSAVAVVEDMLAIGGAVVIVSRCASMKSFVTRGMF